MFNCLTNELLNNGVQMNNNEKEKRFVLEFIFKGTKTTVLRIIETWLAEQGFSWKINVNVKDGGCVVYKSLQKSQRTGMCIRGHFFTVTGEINNTLLDNENALAGLCGYLITELNVICVKCSSHNESIYLRPNLLEEV